MDLNLEGDNIKELFQNLKACICPVYFLINGVEKDSNIEDYIYNINDVLAKYDCDNFLNEDNVINFQKRIEEIKNIWESNEFFSKINIQSMLENGRKIVKM